MNNILKWTTNLSLALFLVLIGCAGINKTKDSKNNWASQMMEMGSSFSELVPDLYNDERFHSPIHKAEVERKIKRFAKASHAISQKSADDFMGKDPLVRASLDGLKENAESAFLSYQSGNTKYAQYNLKNSVNFCFRCHTRTGLGPEFMFWRGSEFFKKVKDPVGRAELYVATRQFDKAKKLLASHLSQEMVLQQKPFFNEAAIKRFLAIAIKIDNHPRDAYALLSKLEDRTRLPLYLTRNLESWESSLIRWMNDYKPKNKLKKAKELIRQKGETEEFLDTDGSYIDYLRASRLLHEVLMERRGKKNAEIYFLLGGIYDYFGRYDFWELPEVYFETCIREEPNTKIAKRCYERYEENILMGFSGSGGYFVPETEKAKLRELKKLAGLKSR